MKINVIYDSVIYLFFKNLLFLCNNKYKHNMALHKYISGSLFILDNNNFFAYYNFKIHDEHLK